MKRLPKLLIIISLTLISGVFLTPKLSLASVIFESYVPGVDDPSSGRMVISSDASTNDVLNVFQATSSVLVESVYLPLFNNTSNVVTVKLYSVSSLSANPNTELIPGNLLGTGTSTVQYYCPGGSPCNGNTSSTISWVGATPGVITGNYYALVIEKSGNNFEIIHASNAVNTTWYKVASTWYADNDPCCGSSSGIVRMSLRGDTPYTNDPTLSWVTPFATSTPFTDFSYWKLHINNFPTSSANEYKIEINYSTPDLSTLYDWTDSTCAFTLSGNVESVGDADCIKTHALYLSQYGSSTPWSVEATLTRTTRSGFLEVSELLDTQSLSFNVVSGTSTVFAKNIIPPKYNIELNPESTSTSAFFVDCSAYDSIPFFSSGTIPGFFCAGKKLSYGFIGWVLVPPDWAFEDLKNAYNFSDVLPLNLIYGVSNGIEVSGTWVVNGSAGATSTALTLKVPNGSGEQITLADSNFLKSYILKDPNCDSTCANLVISDWVGWYKIGLWGVSITKAVFMFL